MTSQKRSAQGSARRRLLLTLGYVLWLAACKPLIGHFDSLPCESDGRCLEGYACNPMSNLCVPLVTVACDGSGVCPSTVATGDPCPSAGSFVPCDDRASSCDAGCRTCDDTLAWSACSLTTCKVGVTESCGACNDNCALSVTNASARCDSSAMPAHCDYTACAMGFIDLDGKRQNGCECALQNGGVDVPCNGVDEDCDGADAIQVDSVDNCGGCGMSCQGFANVVTAACDTSAAPICNIVACAAGFIDADMLPETGCEIACTPTGTELCDGVDNDCNGIVDDVPTLAVQTQCNTLAPGTHVTTWACQMGACAPATCDPNYWDVQASVAGCEYSCTATLPATESCDGVDNDCDGTIDNVGGVAAVNADCIAQNPPTAVRVARWQCTGGFCEVATCVAGYVNVDTDPTNGCEVTCTPAAAPSGSSGPVEICDAGGQDEDCNGDNNELNASGCTPFYRDSDSDGAGVTSDSRCLCVPAGVYSVTGGGDCNDAVASVRPGAPEVIANGVDDNCDGQELCYLDADSDGYRPGAGAGTVASTGNVVCTDAGEAIGSAPTGDCDDAVPGTHPGATELVNNGVDDNCDGIELCYRDADNDGYRPNATATTGSANLSCSDSGEATSAAPTGDCDDSKPAVYTGAIEVVANGIDDDCDGFELCYKDADNDGYRPSAGATTGSLNLSCADSGEAVPSDPVGDCNDTPVTGVSIHSGATETIADGIDQNCDGFDSCYQDLDDDGYGSNVIVVDNDLNCTNTSAFTAAVNTDCNDGVSSIRPGATEIVDDGIDEDCNGQELCYQDADNDGHRPLNGSLTVTSGNTVCTDAFEAVSSDPTDDCNDGPTGATIFAGATEVVGDGIDQNCDGHDMCYVDADVDTYRTNATTGAVGATCSAALGEANNTAPSGDCNDGPTGFTIHPGATEVVGDGIDQNCNGRDVCYVDADVDTYRTNATTGSAGAVCNPAGGEANNSAPSGDCNDGPTGFTIHPGASEVIGDGIDQDCSGHDMCYVDADKDGYRTNATIAAAGLTCVAASGEANNAAPSGDCNDGPTGAPIHPGATDVVGDNIDQDCNGHDKCFSDGDLDGYRTSLSFDAAGVFCSTGAGEALSTAPSGDCNDGPTGFATHPGATEIIDDGIDEDCNGQELCYKDTDNDGYRPGNGSTTVTSANLVCTDSGETNASAPTGDCNDGPTGFATHPGASDVVGDGIDQNCDSHDMCYVDDDLDGYRTNATIGAVGTTCSAALGEANNSAPSGDCNDGPTGAPIHPGASEVIGDNVDQNCDTKEVCYVDADLDTYRTGATGLSSDSDCNDAGEALASAATGDCNDGPTGAAINPGATEVAGDNIDQDCSGTEMCFKDADNDGYRPDAVSTVLSADADCNDANEAIASDPTTDCHDGPTGFSVHPGATDVAGDNIDQDCDGHDMCYTDADLDGYRTSATVIASGVFCSAGAGEALSSAPSGDCNDGLTGFAIHPGATENIDNGIDEDCNGQELCYRDADNDGYRPGNGTATVASANLVCSDSGETNDTAPTGDCNDGPTGAATYPGAPEVIGDSVDQNCDGVDLCYFDGDDDGYGSTTPVDDTDMICTNTSALTSNVSTDCDDTNANINPGKTEIVSNGIDDNCNGLELCYIDIDGDGFRAGAGTGTTGSTNLACTDPGQATSSAPTGDCNDNLSSVYPGAAESCNNVDDDCNGVRDNGFTNAVCACANNGTAALYEICSNTRDDNCNMSIDEGAGPPTCGPVWWQCTYDYRKPITLTVNSAIVANYSVSVSFDHAALVSGGKALANGNDLRVVYYDGSTHSELPRVLDPDSAWASTGTTIWFQLPVAHTGSTSNSTSYEIYYGNPSATGPTWNETNVFHFADFFTRADNNTIGSPTGVTGWTMDESGGTDIDIVSNGVSVPTGGGLNANHRPFISHSFTAFGSTERVGFRLGFNWKNAAETTWRVYMQLGNNPAAPAEATSTTINTSGIGVNLTYAGAGQYTTDEDGDDDGAGPDINRAISAEGFGYIAPTGTPGTTCTTCTARQLDVVSGVATVNVQANIQTDTFDMQISRAPTGATTSFTGKGFSNTMTGINTVRLMASDVSEGNFTQRRFEYVIIRKLVATEPTTSLGSELASTFCP